MFNLGKFALAIYKVHVPSACSLAASVGAFSVPTLKSVIQKSNFSSLVNNGPASRSILAGPPPVLTTQVAGLKVRYALKKRCKDCYLVVRNERTYVMCRTHPRHKQMQPVKKPRYTWILTHASQSKVRPW